MNRGETPGAIDEWLKSFAQALDQQNGEAATELFAGDAAWRDLLAFSWNIVTVEKPQEIRQLLDDTVSLVCPSGFSVVDAPSSMEGMISFDTVFGSCQGYVRLQNGRAKMLFTALQQLRGHEEKLGEKRPSGLYDDLSCNWLDRVASEQEKIGREEQPYVLIVGGGQGGLALGARLRVLGVPALILDKHPRVGDQWRSRYKSLSLHDPVWYDHMPYIPFPDTWPVFTPKDKLADFLESYASMMELNIWTGTEFVSGKYDDKANQWTAVVHRNGEVIRLQPRHLVMAVGNAGFPITPDLPGKENFEGVQLHSSEYRSGEDYAEQKVVVVGGNNSAHDICADLVEHGNTPTMVQRSTTLVLRAETNAQLAAPLYSETALKSGITTEHADFLSASIPLRFLERMHRDLWTSIAASDAQFYQNLLGAGFQLDFGEDGTGLWIKYLRRASGYYIDVGASEMISDGRIDLLSGKEIERVSKNGLVLSNGDEIAADTIVYATGFGSMEEWVKRLISSEVAEKIGQCWGYGSNTRNDPGPWDGELRNMWKPTAQRGLWFHGGNLQQSRFYSHYLALQLKARFEDVAIRTWG
ncbi:putative flavoprotein involved in K+ transport [Parasphingorhabdus marina DSM 22363]|uniref:Putative flavoprotein involved in K+ transport n=1 Tax=Parasphingorhabdus marina DSM 22363 TaxID=1123272 RepID=A0A1N6D472_9SPHN|nr:NAD(P)/FAD-dependent oxidoreductase [Parasphingorhabdus marina]SIN65630.1 putative flavoprotein involved in K+ transport [Parasphingorhabdus marina DSM 22363]